MSYETLSMAAAGWILQRDYTIEPQFRVAEDQRELGNVCSTAVSERSLRAFSLTYIAHTRDAAEYLQSFFRRHVGSAGRFWFSLPEYVASPDKAPTLTAVSGGTQAQRTITMRSAWRNASGTTKASPTGTILVPASNLVHVEVEVYPPSVTQCVIYAAEDDAGDEEEQTVLSVARSWTQPNTALLDSTASPPAQNGALEIALCKLADTYQLRRGTGTSYSVALKLEEVYA